MATREQVEEVVSEVPEADGFILYEERGDRFTLLAERRAATGGGARLIVLCPGDESRYQRPPAVLGHG